MRTESDWLDDVGKTAFAWPTLLLAVCAVGGFVLLGLASASGALPYAVTIPLQGFVAFASFTPMHDASHKAIAPGSRWIDEVVGWICGVPLLAPFSGLKYLHLEHHRHTNDPIHDPDAWSSKAKTRLGIALRWLVLDLHYMVRYMSGAPTRPRSEVITSALGFGALFAAWAAAIATGHVVELFLCWLVPSRIAIVIISVFFDWIPHAPRKVTRAEDPYRASNVYEHAWITPLLLAQNYHLVHHLFPGVPFYRYGAVYWQVRDELLARGADVRRIGARIRPPLPQRLLEVTHVIEETAYARTFVFDTPADFAYRAGQFVVVHLPTGAKRCYSISRADGTLAITVKRQGAASSWLHEHMRPGTQLRLDKPAGRFILDDQSTRPLVCFAAGSGITPIMSLVDAALPSGRRIVVVYTNKSSATTIFRERLEALGDRIELVMRYQRIDAALVEHHAAGADVYACGPAGFLELVESVAPHAKIERFTRPAFVIDAPVATTFVGIRRGQRHSIDIATGATLLAAARAAGLQVRASCEEGYCGTCAVRVTCGRVASSSGPLDDGELARGFVLACSARALAGEGVVVDFDATPEETR